MPAAILHIVFTLETGGMENGLVNVARQLAPEEFTVHVCCLERRGPFAARLPQPENLSVLGKPPGLSFATVRKLGAEIRKVRPRIIHTHGFGPLLYSVFATGLGLGPPIVHGEHGMLYPAEQRLSHRLARRFLYQCCRRIHTVSEGLRRHFIGFGFPGSRMEVIVNGVDTERFAPGASAPARQRAGLPADGAVIGIVGSFSERKRHGLLFEAFEVLARERQDVSLLVVGGDSGTFGAKVTAQAKASVASDRIHLAGFQGNPAPYYQAMDLLVVPSVNEGLSNAALEAMACGIPVLAHDACGNEEIIRDGVDGRVCRLENAAQLHAELKLMLADSNRLAEMGRQARSKIVEHFSLAGMVRGYETMYRGLL